MCVFYKWPETGTSGSHLHFLKDDYAALINCKINFLYTIGKLLLEGLRNDSKRKFYTLSSGFMLEEMEGRHGGVLC